MSTGRYTSPLKSERKGRGQVSGLLASHPLQIRPGCDQLQPLLVAVADRELLHARRLSSTCRGAPHAVRTWRRALLQLQVRKFPGEASILAVLGAKPFNLLLTFLPVHSCLPQS